MVFMPQFEFVNIGLNRPFHFNLRHLVSYASYAVRMVPWLDFLDFLAKPIMQLLSVQRRVFVTLELCKDSQMKEERSNNSFKEKSRSNSFSLLHNSLFNLTFFSVSSIRKKISCSV